MQSTVVPESERIITPAPKKRGRNETFEHLLGRLSHQSVAKHFDAYADIPWDDPAYRIDVEDPRWERTTDDPLGATEWYRTQPQAVRARIGLHSACAHMWIGVEFESVLKRGLLEFASTLRYDDPALRYCYHEVIEEAQHSLMFREFVIRSGLPVGGLDGTARAGARRVVKFGRDFPELFFMFVLGGEEPIDSVQREVLKSHKAELHPLIKRLMQIHVTEEARHLCFAREYLKRRVPSLGRAKMLQLGLLTPVILGQMARLMMKPPTRLLRHYDVPDDVIDEAYRDNPMHSAKTLESISKVRELCEELGVINRHAVHLWKRFGIWPEGRQLGVGAG